MDQRTKALMMMHKALYSKDDLDRWYVSRKEGGRGHASNQDSVVASIQQLKDCMRKANHSNQK